MPIFLIFKGKAMSANNPPLKSMHLVANILLVVSIALFGMMILLIKQERQNLPSNAVRQCYTNKNNQSDCYVCYQQSDGVTFCRADK